MTLLSDFKLNIINVALGQCYLLAYSGEKLKIVYMVGKLNAGCFVVAFFLFNGCQLDCAAVHVPFKQ